MLATGTVLLAMASTRADHLVWKQTTVEGRPALYGEAGDGLPVLFLHGWGLGQHSYKRAMKRLVQLGCRVFAPALPGFGGTADLPKDDVSLSGYARWVDLFLEAVGVEVDIELGFVRVLRVVSVNDVGRAINPQLVQGQVEGAVVQALGYAVMENLVSREGRIRNPYLSTYLIPTILDVPVEVRSVILEYADPIGPWGARGMAEMPLIPLAPAIAAAIHDATGVWIDTLPFVPDRVVAALREQGVGVL